MLSAKAQMTAGDIETSIQQLLSEGPAAARERERNAFDRAVGSANGEIVLFGAGNLGRRTLAGLRRAGVSPVAMSDNNPKLWGTTISGTPVLSPSDAAQRFGKSATFVLTIWGALGSDRMAQRIENLRALGCSNVVPFVPLYWKFAKELLPHYTIDLPHKAHEQAEQVLRAAVLWADESSRQEYLAQLRWRTFGDFDCLPAPVQEALYFPCQLWDLSDHEVFVDCGAYDGDSVALFLAEVKGQFEAIFAFEPDPGNFALLQQSTRNLPTASKIYVQQAAVGERAGTVRFSASADESSHVGGGDLVVDCVQLDEILAGAKPTIIKMDIEGSELDAIRGARNLIEQHAPVLAISSYHLQNHLWEIPLLIESMNSEYKFFLRPYRIEGWDLVCFAIPRRRLKAGGSH